MRTRSRSTREYSAGKTTWVRTRKSNGQITNLGTTVFPTTSMSSSSTISDELNDPRTLSRVRATLKRQLLLAERYSVADRQSVISDIYLSHRQVHNCTHTSKRIRQIHPERVLLFANGTYTFTLTDTNCGWLQETFGNSQLGVLNGLTNLTKHYTSSGFHGLDWYALLDKWHDACNSFLPSSSLLGESMVEHAIFKDAFLLLLNPSRALKKFVEVGASIAKRKDTLGRVSKVLRTSADSYLGYNFGVRPAVSQIRDILAAHGNVQRRLAFLRASAGNYVPVRVRGIVPSSFTNSDFSGSNFGLHCSSKDSIGVISALGKVRPDLDFRDEWASYWQYFGLHKVIGLAWELIPFSFVVDWVTNAGEYINQYTTPNFNSPFYNIRNMSYSYVEHLSEKIVLGPDAWYSPWSCGLTMGSSPVSYGAEFQTRSYIRKPGLPKSSGSVDFSRLGVFHGLSSGALLIQKILK